MQSAKPTSAAMRGGRDRWTEGGGIRLRRRSPIQMHGGSWRGGRVIRFRMEAEGTGRGNRLRSGLGGDDGLGQALALEAAAGKLGIGHLRQQLKTRSGC